MLAESLTLSGSRTARTVIDGTSSAVVVTVDAGAASRVSLGTAVFGGMLFATVGGLIITPFLFYVVKKLTSRGGVSEPAPSPAPAVAGEEESS